MSKMSRLAPLFLLAMLARVLCAQATIPVSGVKVVDNNLVPLTGQLVFTVTDTTDTPITYTPQGGSPTTAPYVINVVGGAVQNSGGFPPTIANPATMSPANTRYRIQVESTGGSTVYLTFPLTNITQTFFSYDAYAVPLGVTASGRGFPKVPCSPGAMYNNTLASDPYPWVCSQFQGDSSVYWTQNPSLNPACQRGNNQAMVSTLTGKTFCVDAAQAFVTPGFVWSGPPSGKSPSQIGLVPLSQLCAGGACGSGIPGGSNQDVQINASNAFGADHGNFTYNTSSHTLNTQNMANAATLSTTSIASYNPFLPLQHPQGHDFYASNYFQTDASGNVNGGQFEPHNPVTLDDYEQQRQMCCDTFVPYNFTLHIPTGGFNDSASNGNMSSMLVGLHSQTSYQGGGQLSLQNSQTGQGDDVLIEFSQAGVGAGRGNDEYTEQWRGNTSANPATFGGTLTLGTLTAQGNQPMQFSAVGGAGYDFSASGEHRLLIDLTKEWSSGNISNIASISINSLPFIEVTLDAASGYTAHWGTSTTTSLTQPINNNVWTGTCPSWTDTGTQVPSGNAFIDDRTGVNLYHQQNPGLNSPAAWCVSVGSTAGMSAGTLLYITDGTVDAEYTTITSVVDATHFIANIKRQKLTGAVVSFGGGVGTGLSNGDDDRSPGFYNGGDVQQTAETRLVYPVVYSESGNKAVIDVTGNGGAYEMKTWGYGANTPKAPLTITATVVGGVVTGISSNYTSADFTANVIGALGGGQLTLPPPTLTYTCTVNPVITFTFLPTGGLNGTQPTYQPTLVSGGSGCTGTAVTVNAETPNPLNVYPATFIYKTTDPASTDPKTWSTDGYVLTEPIATSLWANGDQSEETRWWQDFVGWGHVGVIGEPDSMFSSHFGSLELHQYEWEHSGTPHMAYQNLTPLNYYYGTSAGGWQKSANPADDSTIPGPLMQITGGSGGLASFDIPPTGPIINVHCTLNYLPGQDAPCAHGIHKQTPLFSSDETVGSAETINYDPTAHQFIFATLENLRTGLMTYGVTAPKGILTGSSVGIEGTWSGQSLVTTLLTQTLGQTYASWGNGSQGDSTSQIGAGTLAAGTVIAGASLPVTPSVQQGGTPGSTTYTYACTAVSANGGETTATANGTTTTGNATLSATNYNRVVCWGNVGDQSVNVYRTSTTGGLSAGKICSNVVLNRNDEFCNDIGQAAGAAPPAVDTSGQLKVAGVTFTGVQGNTNKIAAASGTFTTNNVRVTDASGNAIDGGVAISSLCQSNGTNCPATIANVQVVLPTATLTANTCSAPATVTMTGVTTTSTFTSAFASNPTAVTGYGSSGGLSISLWPTANTLNWSLCNPTGSSITPGAMTINVGVR